jgi:hypothetical protein
MLALHLRVMNNMSMNNMSMKGREGKGGARGTMIRWLAALTH